MFRPANVASRIPTYLQPYTKENAIWQLKLTAVLMVGIVVQGVVEQRRTSKKYAKTEES